MADRFWQEAPAARRRLHAAVGLAALAALLWLLFLLRLSDAVSHVFIGGQTLAGVAPAIVLMAVLGAGRAALHWAADFTAHGAAAAVKLALRRRLAGHLIALGPAFVRGERTGRLVHLATQGVESLEEYVTQFLPARTLAGFVPVLVLLAVLLIDPWSAPVLLFTGPLLVFLLALIGARTRDLSRRREGELAWMSAHFLDLLQGLPTLKLFGRSRDQAATVETIGRRYSSTMMDVLRTAFQTSLVLEWGTTAATALVAIEVSFRLMHGWLPFDRALAVLLITPEFFQPLRQLALRYHAGSAGKAAAESLYALLDTPAPAGALAGTRPPPDRLDVRFEDVHLAYDAGQRPALRGLSLTLAEGQTTALLGSTGAGKSTVAGLLLRFLEPDRGAISVGGVPLAALDPVRWRERVAWVPQHPHLFPGTVAENLRLARPGASQAALVVAAREAQAHDFIVRLPRGYDTPLGERGARLSGGQAQRLAIARALLKDAPLLILDEATSQLDASREAGIGAALLRLRPRPTVLLITHRPALAATAQAVVRLEHGRAVGSPALAPAAGVVPIALVPAAAGARGMSTGRRLLALLAPYRWSLLLAFFLACGTLAAGVGLIAAASYLISKAALVTAFVDVAVAITLVRALAIGRAALRYAERYLTHGVTLRILGGLRAWFFAAVEPLAPARLQGHRSGDLLARIGADVETLDGFFVRGLLPPAAAAVVAVLVALLLGRFAAPLGVTALALLALTGVGLPLVTRYLARAPAGDAVAARGAHYAALAGDITGLAEVLAFGQEAAFRNRMEHHAVALARPERRLAALRGAGEAIGLLLAGLAGVAVLTLAVPMVTAGRIEGLFLALLPLTTIAGFEAVLPLAGAMQQRQSSYAAAGRLFEVVDAPAAVADPPRPLPAPAGHGVELLGLRFRYGPGEPLVLDGFELRVPAGERVALVGPSGAGKSTVLHLLLRFWEPEAGQLRIGGRDVRACRAEDVRRLLGVVPQQPYLFNGTLRDNLLVARGDATEAQLAAAIRQAHLEPFVAALPRGYDTLVGENGLKLSGGERQRLALARVILKDAPIVLLDEATANLDEITEAGVVRTLEAFLAGRTALIVSHRPALLRLATGVVALDPHPAG